MTSERYPEEVLDQYDDDGTMPGNVETLAEAIVGHKIVSAEMKKVKSQYSWQAPRESFVLTLDNGKKVVMRSTDDCCAYTDLEAFLLHPEAVNHVIMGVGTTDGYNTWHIYADWGDILKLEVGWSPGNPFYYGYGFDIEVLDYDNS